MTSLPSTPWTPRIQGLEQAEFGIRWTPSQKLNFFLNLRQIFRRKMSANPPPQVGYTIFFSARADTELRGIIRYIGPCQSRHGTWYGVELDAPRGDSDGTFDGRRYFQCRPRHGLFRSEQAFASSGAVIRPPIPSSHSALSLSEMDSPAPDSISSHPPASPPSESETLKRQVSELNRSFKENQRNQQQKVASINAAHNLTKVQIESEYLEEIIRLEKDLLTLNRPWKQSLAECHSDKFVRVFTEIDREYLEYETELREIVKSQSADLQARRAKQAQIESAISAHTEAIAKQQKNRAKLAAQLEQLTAQFEEHSPDLREKQSLRIRIAGISKSVTDNEKRSNILAYNRRLDDRFVRSIAPHFGLLVSLVAIVMRIQAKAGLLPESAEREELLHFCEWALMVFAQRPNCDEAFAELLAAAENRVNERATEFGPAALVSALQGFTPLPIHLAVTSHLIRGSAHRTRNDDNKYELNRLAAVVPRIIHPSLVAGDHEAAEKLALNLRNDLRIAESGERVSFARYEREIASLLVFVGPVDLRPVFSVRESARRPNERKSMEEDLEMPVLRRKIADSMARIDRLSTYSESLAEFRSTFDQRVDEIARDLAALGQ
jgi:hypothetical protein